MELKQPRFLADSMLGSIARKLRIFGFDTIYIAHAHDNEILKIGIEQNRVILTADKELFKRIVKADASGVLVDGGRDIEDLVHILSKSGIKSLNLGSIGSRCSLCNGMLKTKRPEEVKNDLPGRIAELHREFYQCQSCSKVYWEGGHLGRIKTLAKNIDNKLSRAVAA